jgi:hypothetical protein
MSLTRAVAVGRRLARNGVVIFRRGRPCREIAAPEPDVRRGAGDCAFSERAALEEAGPKIAFLPFLRGFSATRLVRRMRAAGLA